MNIFCSQVLMKDLTTPVPPNEFKSVIKKSLENASQTHFDRISEEAKEKCEFFMFISDNHDFLSLQL